MSSPIVEQEFEIGLSDTAKATMSAAITALVKASLITAYSTSATYAVGDFVYYSGDGKIYKCTTAISTAEAWTSAHWSEATLNDVIDSVGAAVSTVNGKANVDGNYPTMTVGKSETAKNVEPYSDDSGAEQSNPVISQGTGTDNNTAIVATGNFAQLREKQGNTVAWNNIGNWNHRTFTYAGIAVTYNNGTFHVEGTATISLRAWLGNITNINGHKVLVTTDTGVPKVYAMNSAASKFAFDVAGTDDEFYWGIVIDEGETVNYDFRFVVSDLTEFFGGNGNIPQDLLAHPDHFFWYYNGSLAYDAGSLENANGVKLVCTHRNLFDGTFSETGKYLDKNGESSASSSWNISNFIMVVPNKPIHFHNTTDESTVAAVCWFDKDMNFISGANQDVNHVKTAPANARFMKTSIKASLASTCTISLYYTTAEGGEDYDQYYEYKEPTVIDTGSEVLRSAGNAHDVKLPDGTIQRNVGVVDLSTLSFTYDSSRNYMRATVSDMKVMPDAANNIPNLTSKYEAIVSMDGGGYASLNSDYISVPRATRDIVVHATSASDTPTGTLHYELATPTTEEGTAFPENVDIDDYGMMYWLDENDELVGIPQGAKFFYPFNYAGSLDDLYHYVGGDMQKIIRTYSTDAKELAENPDINKNWDTAPTQGSVKPVTSGGIFEADRQLKDALGGTLRQMLAATKSIDFADTAYADLDNLPDNYIGYNNTAKAWNILVPSDAPAKSIGSSDTPNIIASAGYEPATRANYGQDIPNKIYINSEGTLFYINNGSSAVKPTGILAYEKAE